MDSSSPPVLRLDGVETLVERGRLSTILTVASTVLVLVSLGVFGQATGPLLAFARIAVLVSPVTALLGLALGSPRSPRYGSLCVAGEELCVERAARSLRVPLRELVSGTHNSRTHVVTFRRRRGDLLHVRVAGAEDAQRLLEATRMDASRRPLRMRLGNARIIDVCTLVFAPFVLGPLTAVAGKSSIWLTMALTVGLLLVLRRLFGPAELTVGADGIIARQGFTTRFVPFGRVASVEMEPGGWRAPVIFRLTDGSTVEVRTQIMSADDRGRLADRIADARRAWAMGEAGEGALARVERRGRSAAAWREAMREVTVADGYREPGVTREALVEVVESPAVTVERRMGAALALSGTDDDGLRHRIRVAAEACADERVRVALFLAADGALDDTAMEEALAGEEEARRGPIKRAVG